MARRVWLTTISTLFVMQWVSILMVLAFADIIWTTASDAATMDSAPASTLFTGFPRPTQTASETFEQQANLASSNALRELRALGPKYAAIAESFRGLSPSQILERLALRPPVGPSTIASALGVPRAPAAAVNYAGPSGPIASAPAVAFLLARWGAADDYTPDCTATLVRPTVLLTASHCLCAPTGTYPDIQTCRNGTATLPSSDLEDPTRLRVYFQHLGIREVKSIIQPNDYTFSNQKVHDDFALLILKSPVDWVIPADLTSKPPSKNGVTYIAGFGYSWSPGADDLSSLQTPGLKVRAKATFGTCRKMHYLDAKSAICSTYLPTNPNYSSTICDGDSGGPLWSEIPGPNSSEIVSQIGVASGRNTENCAQSTSISFEMSLSYPPYVSWLNSQIGADLLPKNPLWPPFSDNLRNILDRRQKGLFGDDGSYSPDTWAVAPKDSVILATMNTPASIKSFEVVDRLGGPPLCVGRGGVDNHTPNVDYCFANVKASEQFRIVAVSNIPKAPLQFVISNFPEGTSFPDER